MEATTTMPDIFQAMSLKELATFKEQYADNPSVVALLAGYEEVKAKQEEEAKVKVKRDKVFLAATKALLGELPAWSTAWRLDPATNQVRVTTVEVEDLENGEEEVLLGGDRVMRYPKSLVRVVEVSTAVTYIKAGRQSTETKNGGQRQIHVFKREGLVLVDKGIYPSGADACKALGLNHGTDSGPRFLRNEGYIVEPA